MGSTKPAPMTDLIQGPPPRGPALEWRQTRDGPFGCVCPQNAAVDRNRFGLTAVGRDLRQASGQFGGPPRARSGASISPIDVRNHGGVFREGTITHVGPHLNEPPLDKKGWLCGGTVRREIPRPYKNPRTAIFGRG